MRRGLERCLRLYPPTAPTYLQRGTHTLTQTDNVTPPTTTLVQKTPQIEKTSCPVWPVGVADCHMVMDAQRQLSDFPEGRGINVVSLYYAS